jgi:hypothetical protein
MPTGSSNSKGSPSGAELGKALLGRPATASELSRVPLRALLERTQGELAQAARRLGLKGVSRLRKGDIAERVHQALRRKARPATGAKGGSRTRSTVRKVSGRARAVRRGGRRAAGQPQPAPNEAETGARSKFDLGPREKPSGGEHIPWSYNVNRVTAMAMDPRRMYVYWEVRDDAIQSARDRLGPGGKNAWLSLRVYDITDRIFDGTNAHTYFDTKVERTDRQWFFTIGKPTSTHCVEVGMKSREGYFQKIARSGRVDFPRAEPSAPGPVEWLSVHAITGELGAPTVGAPRPPAVAPPAPSPAGLPESGAGGEFWVVNDFSSLAERAILSGWESQDLRHTEWIGREGRLEWVGGAQRFEWVGPMVRTSWEAGPFPVPVEAPGVVEERHEGPVLVQKLGDRTRIIYGPWRVVIRGIGGRAERRVLATWEVRKSWVTRAGFEVVGGKLRWQAVGAENGGKGPLGASERVVAGASERRWLAGSEVRLAGASELFRVGASELGLLGASETLFAGASEKRYRGGSERRWRGASETLARGASERAFRGASERIRRGASERQYAGESERGRRGASEQRLEASESRYPGASDRPARKGRYPRRARRSHQG